MVSLAWSPVAYHRALRRLLPDVCNMTKPGMALQFGWHFFTIGARVIAMSLFASVFTYWVFIIVVIHWGVMYIWILLQEWTFSDSQPRSQQCLNVVMAMVYVFCQVALVDGHTRMRYLVYYVIVFTENTVMILLWYTTSATMDWWYITPALITVFVGFFVGIAFQMIYYRWFHPNSCPSCPDGRPIRLWVPWKKLWIFKTLENDGGETSHHAQAKFIL